MSIEEAKAWLTGQRSWTNIVPEHPRDTWQVRIQEADAASMQQAYWVLKAHKEDLV